MSKFVSQCPQVPLSVPSVPRLVGPMKYTAGEISRLSHPFASTLSAHLGIYFRDHITKIEGGFERRLV